MLAVPLVALALSGTPTLSIADDTTLETDFDTIGSVRVSLSAPSDVPVSVHWATADGTADSTDYVPDSGTLTIPAGQTSGRIGVMVKGDALDEPDETVYVDLSDAKNATIANTRGTLTIIDSDPAPFRLLDAWVDARWSVHRSYTRVTRFTIHRPGGTVLHVRCRGGGCPLRIGAKLRPGALVEVRILAPYEPLIGRGYQYRIRAGKPPRFTALCLPVSGENATRC
jgi:hypothetical protein